MTLYSRHQLLMILLLVVAAGAGLAIDHWRRARPALVERLERLDRTAPASTANAAPPRVGGARRARPATAHERPPRAGRPALATPERPLDLNRASAPELARLPGIGQVLAARIVEARPFAALDELARVRGVRPATLERLRPLLSAPP